jgi:hypothetical protein
MMQVADPARGVKKYRDSQTSATPQHPIEATVPNFEVLYLNNNLSKICNFKIQRF